MQARKAAWTKLPVLLIAIFLLTPASVMAQEPDPAVGTAIVIGILGILLLIIFAVAIIAAVSIGLIGLGAGAAQTDDE